MDVQAIITEQRVEGIRVVGGGIDRTLRIYDGPYKANHERAARCLIADVSPATRTEMGWSRGRILGAEMPDGSGFAWVVVR